MLYLVAVLFLDGMDGRKMIKDLEKREGKAFEVQWYKDDGNDGRVVQCDSVEELAQYLARSLWGSVRGFKNNPTVWHNGKRWCLGEYTPVDDDGKEY